MKKQIYLSLVIVALLCLTGWTGYARGQRTNSVRQTWEYHIDGAPTFNSIPGANVDPVQAERLLNQRAAEGWELAAVGQGLYYFKRAR